MRRIPAPEFVERFVFHFAIEIPGSDIECRYQKSVGRIKMMQVMPITIRCGEGKLFYKDFLRQQICLHLLNRNIIIGNSRRFTVSFDAIKIKFHHQCWLMGFGSL